MNFLTHRDTQPVSRWIRDLVVKSSTQESKQWDTRCENICGYGISEMLRHVMLVVVRGGHIEARRGSAVIETSNWTSCVFQGPPNGRNI
jgi:hypothetical protein